MASASAAAARHPHKFVHAQPRTYAIGWKAIVSLPFRLCNPPPAVGKVRSCGVTPLLKLQLQDVLDRKHLPPLGLKDFEEWLLFVEMSPENLYFTLWLQEYKTRHSQWKSQEAFHSKNAPVGFTTLAPSSQYSSHLAMFYSRAKKTFLTKGAEYELNLTDTHLAPFLDPPPCNTNANNEPHPDPSKFIEIELETRRMLEDSLRRFAHAQLNNAGNNRVLCGILAGLLFCLLGSIPPLALNLARGHDRWARLAALPGLWVGLMVFFSALNGICVGVYIFGDLRQLRKFELARPTISKPQPLPTYGVRRRSVGAGAGGGGGARPLSEANSILPIQQPRKQSLVPMPVPPHVFPPSHHHHHVHAGNRMRSVSSASTTDSRVSGDSDGHSSSGSSDDNIQISPAYYDADEVDTSAIYCEDEESAYRFPAPKGQDEHHQQEEDRLPNSNFINPGAADASSSRSNCTSVDSPFTSTATFIHPFEFTDYYGDNPEDEEAAIERSKELPGRHQAVFPFDFDSLPHRRGRTRSETVPVSANAHPLAQPPASPPPDSREPMMIIPQYPSHTYHPSSISGSSFSRSQSSHPPTSPTPLLLPHHHSTPTTPINVTFTNPFTAFPGASSLPASPTSPSPTAPFFPGGGSGSAGYGNNMLPGASALRLPDPVAPPPMQPMSFLARLQEKCNIAKWRLQTGFLEPDASSPGVYAQQHRGRSAKRSRNMKRYRDEDDDDVGADDAYAFEFDQKHPPIPHPSSRFWVEAPHAHALAQAIRPSSDSEKTAAAASRSSRRHPKSPSSSSSPSSSPSSSSSSMQEAKAKRRFRLMNAVPAFAVPLTRVLSPVVVRAQWEIVIRSAVVALVVSMSVVGAFLALPVRR